MGEASYRKIHGARPTKEEKHCYTEKKGAGKDYFESKSIGEKGSEVMTFSLTELLGLVNSFKEALMPFPVGDCH